MKLSTFFTLILLAISVSLFSVAIGASSMSMSKTARPEGNPSFSAPAISASMDRTAARPPTSQRTGRPQPTGRIAASLEATRLDSRPIRPPSAAERAFASSLQKAPTPAKSTPQAAAGPTIVQKAPTDTQERASISTIPTLNGEKLDPRFLVMAVYFLFQFDSIKEMTFDIADKLRLYRVRDVLQRFIPSWITDHPNRGMILSLFAGALGMYTCSRYYSWKTEAGTYDWINIILAGIAGHFSYSSVKMIFMRPEYATSFYRWVEDLGQTHAQRKTYPPIIPTRK